MTRKTFSLDDAYTIREPEDSRRFYREWAEAYDTEFAATHGFVAPAELARLFREREREGDSPVLDLGAGTGLVGEALGGVIDGIDISADMLAVAEGKGIYRGLIEADLTQELELPDQSYGGMISSGTFTHGHVGPVCLPELMRIAKPGALFVLGINAAVYDASGFGSAFARLVAGGLITPVDFAEIRFYEGADHSHADDRGLAAIFRRA